MTTTTTSHNDASTGLDRPQGLERISQAFAHRLAYAVVDVDDCALAGSRVIEGGHHRPLAPGSPGFR